MLTMIIIVLCVLAHSVTIVAFYRDLNRLENKTKELDEVFDNFYEATNHRLDQLEKRIEVK